MKQERLLHIFFTFLKGILMGMADLVPGISGGTILFITGIYERFIEGIKNIAVFGKTFFKELITGKKIDLKSLLKLVDFKFFIPLIVGVIFIVLVGSGFILFMLKSYPAQVFSLFAGLIIASTIILYNEIGKKNIYTNLFLVLGLLFGLLVSVLQPVKEGSASYVTIFFVGMVSLLAMMLPGISGSYMLILMGKYEFMLGVAHNITSKYLYALFFGLGGVISLLVFSKLLSYLLKSHKSKTFAFLTGLMFGALYSPITTVLASLNNTLSVFVSVIFLIIGIILVLIINKLSRKKIVRDTIV
ncbi:DUF368 domain-containing protein [Candidatus Woesearchaeota archaeon]|nr:DUF368 domain-containing protein [Candidatus Woesearchaeota archaeon]